MSAALSLALPEAIPAGRRYAIAVAVTVAVALLRAAMWPVLGESAPLLLLIAGPALAAYFGGLGPGLVATALGAAIGTVFFIQPYGGLDVPAGEEQVRLGVFVALGVLVSWAIDARARALGRLALQHRELVEAQQRLVERERRARETLEAAPSGMLLVDRAGRICLANAQAERMFGYSRTELVGMPIEALVPDDLRERHRDERAAYMREPSTRAMGHGRELQARRRDGTGFPVEIGLNPVKEDGAELVLASVLDVSGRRTAEQDRDANRRLLERVVSTAADPIFMKDLQGRYVLANAATAEVLGRPQAEVLGRTDAELLPAEAARRLVIGDREVAATGRPWSEEESVPTPTGTRAYVTTKSPLRDDTGAIVGVVGLARDITQRKAVEESLRQSEERLRLVIDTVQDYAIYVLDAEGRIATWNGGAQAITGWRADEAVGRSWEMLFPEPDLASGEPGKEMARAREFGRFTGEGLRRRKDGSLFWADVALYALRDPAGALRGYVKVARDLTQRREDEERIRTLNAELEDRVVARTRQLEDANAELQGFASNVAHDLRAPLRGIYGFGEALLEDHADRLDETARSHLRRILAGAVRMESLIQDLLAYGRLSRQEMPVGTVDLDAIVREAIENLSAELRESRAELTVAPNLPAVRGNHTVLVQVVQNLASNALKFVDRDARPRVRIDAVREDGQVLLTVADNGIGIEPDHRERIFRVFERLHGQDAYPGTGIGLAIVRKGVERMGGAVGVEAGAAGGSRFWVRLPAAGPAAADRSADLPR